MRYLDIENWNRKQHFEHFNKMADPYFGVVVDVDVTSAFDYAKKQQISFFVVYLHACMKAINSVENLKYRIDGDDKVVIHDIIHASATIARPDNTFGCSFIHFSEDIYEFNENFKKEKERILNSTDLFPEQNTLDCIYCSALPWVNFSGHKEPVSGFKESVPKLGFGQFKLKEGKKMMPVSIIANHALADGYHIGEFFKFYQEHLDKLG